jgi:hypothetical protein
VNRDKPHGHRPAVAGDERASAASRRGRTADGATHLSPTLEQTWGSWPTTCRLALARHPQLRGEPGPPARRSAPPTGDFRELDAERIPRDDWGVGHVAGLLGLWRRRIDGEWWLVLLDTYKERGFDGYQPQPAAVVRQALVREDGRGGGLLLVLPRATVVQATAALRRLGIEPRMWSNGSPEPDDWTWRADPGGGRLTEAR